MGDLQKVKRYSLRQKATDEPERKFGVVSILLLLVATMLGVLGWQYRKHIDVKDTRVSGLTMAHADEVIRLAAVDTSLALYAIDPTVLQDRVTRHPWIRNASIQRLPTGILKIGVSERIPVLTVLTANGRPSHYIDGDCFQMPLSDQYAYDVPLISGRVPGYHPVTPIESQSICLLAKELAKTRSPIDTIVSEFVVDGNNNVTLYTKPTNGYGAVPVQLGTNNFNSQFSKLNAFWDQIVLNPKRIELKKIDLRFESQIVTE